MIPTINDAIKKLLVLLLVFSWVGCEKYLDVKNSSSNIIPTRVVELEAILDNPAGMAIGATPGLNEMFSDYCVLPPSSFEDLETNNQDEYLFSVEPENPVLFSTWGRAYKMIFNCNVVLNLLPTVKDGNTVRGRQLKGHALFYRANTHFMLLEHFSLPYKKETANSLPGIPIKKNPAEGDKTERSSIADSYKSILEDLQEAAVLLPDQEELLTRPDKIAVYALLARIHLVRGEFEKAKDYADKVLLATSYVDDYNTMDLNISLPFSFRMKEVILPTLATGPKFIDAAISRVDNAFYTSYDEHDLRKTAFFTGTYPDNISFRGTYTGWTSYSMFNGFTVPEILLIRAECWAREGEKDKAMDDINYLLKYRTAPEFYQLQTAQSPEDALMKVMEQRKKELLFRGLRAMDLRRLKDDPRFAVTITRTVVSGGETITEQLSPQSLRYALPIPQLVIDRTSIPQNQQD